MLHAPAARLTWGPIFAPRLTALRSAWATLYMRSTAVRITAALAGVSELGSASANGNVCVATSLARPVLNGKGTTASVPTDFLRDRVLPDGNTENVPLVRFACT